MARCDHREILHLTEDIPNSLSSRVMVKTAFSHVTMRQCLVYSKSCTHSYSSLTDDFRLQSFNEQYLSKQILGVNTFQEASRR